MGESLHGPLRLDPGEVLAARFFGADELPENVAFPDHIRPALDAWVQRHHPNPEQDA